MSVFFMSFLKSTTTGKNKLLQVRSRKSTETYYQQIQKSCKCTKTSKQAEACVWVRNCQIRFSSDVNLVHQTRLKAAVQFEYECSAPWAPWHLTEEPEQYRILQTNTSQVRFSFLNQCNKSSRISHWNHSSIPECKPTHRLQGILDCGNVKQTTRVVVFLMAGTQQAPSRSTGTTALLKHI